MSRSKYTGDRISVSEAAEMLGMSIQVLREKMRTNKLNIGSVMPSKRGVNNTYYIYRSRVLEHIKGKSETGTES